jgi:hypothetical protein
MHTLRTIGAQDLVTLDRELVVTGPYVRGTQASTSQRRIRAGMSNLLQCASRPVPSISSSGLPLAQV